MRNLLEPKQIALRINLNDKIYGSFAEIGAGQEVARYFFQAGGASGTVAKTMSAYDMTFSNDIYGKEESGRYVTQSRLQKMLDHEYSLLEERLRVTRQGTCFFAFADTVSALNFKKDNRCHGWMGLRFQTAPDKAPNEVLLHIRMLDKDNLSQQVAVGLVGMNLIHACFNYLHDINLFIESLLDHVSPDRVKIDFIKMDGPDLDSYDERILSLILVKLGYNEIAMFGPDGENISPSDALYKKSIVTLRGRFRPVTKVHLDMLKNGLLEFEKYNDCEKENIVSLMEITLNNLTQNDKGEIDLQDFLDRVQILCALGQTVVISKYQEHHTLIDYFKQFKPKSLGVILGADNLAKVMNPAYYTHLSGGMLEAFGTLFSNDCHLYIYPYRKDGHLTTSENLPISDEIKPLYTFIKDSNKIHDIEGYNESNLHILSDDVIAWIKSGDPRWEACVPSYVAENVKEKCLFEYPCVLVSDKQKFS